MALDRDEGERRLRELEAGRSKEPTVDAEYLHYARSRSTWLMPAPLDRTTPLDPRPSQIRHERPAVRSLHGSLGGFEQFGLDQAGQIAFGRATLRLWPDSLVLPPERITH